MTRAAVHVKLNYRLRLGLKVRRNVRARACRTGRFVQQSPQRETTKAGTKPGKHIASRKRIELIHRSVHVNKLVGTHQHVAEVGQSLVTGIGDHLSLPSVIFGMLFQIS